MINWFTVFAQIVNFLVLVYLLKKFLYGPIVQAMKRRQETVRERLVEAENGKKEAREEAERHRKQADELEGRRQEILEKARNEAEQERHRLIEQAQDQVEKAKTDWIRSLGEQQESFYRDLGEAVGRRTIDIAGRALHDLAGADLDERMAVMLSRRLKDLKKKDRERFADAVKESSGLVTFLNGHGLSQEAVSTLQKVLADTVGSEVELRPERPDGTMHGLALMAGGRKIDWTLEGYLNDLRESLDERFHGAQEKQREQQEKNKQGETETQGEREP